MSEPSSPALSHAIADLYRAFGDGALGRPLYGCDCCTDPGTLTHLAQTPLRQLTAEDLLGYLYSAMSTVGDKEDFRHFFPRLFELAVEDHSPLDLEELGSQLWRAGWKQWVEPQRLTAQRALENLWDTLSIKGYDDATVDSIVCGVALTHMDMEALLAAWETSSAPFSKANLNRFGEYNRDSLKMRRRLSNAFWDESPAQEVAVADWLRRTMGVY